MIICDEGEMDEVEGQKVAATSCGFHTMPCYDDEWRGTLVGHLSLPIRHHLSSIIQLRYQNQYPMQ